MTREERRKRIRRLVDNAPALCAEDVDRLRALLPMGARAATTPVVARPRRAAAAA